jgi:hypothetical protein
MPNLVKPSLNTRNSRKRCFNWKNSPVPCVASPSETMRCGVPDHAAERHEFSKSNSRFDRSYRDGAGAHPVPTSCMPSSWCAGMAQSGEESRLACHFFCRVQTGSLLEIRHQGSAVDNHTDVNRSALSRSIDRIIIPIGRPN